MEIIYVDNHLLAVEKPAGLPTQPSGTSASLEDLAKQWVKKTYQKPGLVFLTPIHRLDRPVGGVVLFARTSKALSRLQEMMRAQSIKRVYLALVEGIPKESEGTLTHYLTHDKFHARSVRADDPEAKKAILHYRLLGKQRNFALLEITLETGRYHQIRAQWAAEGHPVVGDEKYGSKSFLDEHRIALYHIQMELTHPVTKEVIVLNSKRYSAEQGERFLKDWTS